MPIPDGSVVITPRQMYEELQATRQAVERLTNTVEPALGNLRQDVDYVGIRVTDVEKTQEKHGNRMTAVETKLKVLGGVVGTAIAAAAIVVPVMQK